MTTTCQKCGGLLVAERSMDFYSRSARWKCVNCGWSLLENHKSRASWIERREAARTRTSPCNRRNL